MQIENPTAALLQPYTPCSLAAESRALLSLTVFVEHPFYWQFDQTLDFS